MIWFENTLPTPQENLALDEVLLEQADDASEDQPPASWECLRFWELPSPCVIMGRSSRFDLEVDAATTLEDRVPALRRASGGSTVVAGSGCLMYSLVLSYQVRPHLRMLDEAHREVMEKWMETILPWVPEVRMEGTCDLTWRGKKFSGNALRCKRNFLLYHGTILYNFPLPLITRYLLEPPRQPDYRQKRSHSDFLTNVPLPLADCKRRLAACWGAVEGNATYDRTRYQQILQDRYLNSDWHRANSSCSNSSCATPGPSQDNSSSAS